MIQPDAQIYDYLTAVQPLYDGVLGDIQQECLRERLPMIRPETARALGAILSLKPPRDVLEIGCAVGFSAGLIARYLAEGGHITTIDRFAYMIEEAKKNFHRLGLEDTVTLLEGHAQDIVPGLSGPYDFIFLDAAKAQYMPLLSHCMRLLRKGGLFIADDVLQGGSVASPRLSVPRRQRTTHARMRSFLWAISHASGLESSILTVGDGMAVCVKTADNVVFEEIDFDVFA